ncbi:MAG: phage tail tape measure protein [Leptolyngbya sp. SIO1E4]|nr:phage tail tape measure protein [Leptolyngbya sp. SIO1E4]
MAAETELRIKVNADTQAIGGIKQVEKAIRQVAKDNEKASRLAGLLAQEYKLSEKEAAQVAAELRRVQAETRKAGNEARGLANIFDGVAQGIGQQLTSTATDAVRSTVSQFKELASAAIDAGNAFDAARAKVSTLTDDADGLAEVLENVTGEVRNQVGTTELLEGSYDILSAGFTDTADAAKITEASVKGAIGGFSDFGTVADAATSVLNAYGETADEVDSIVDKFIATQNAGKITVDQYAQQIGKVAPLAAQAGVSLDELNGFIATATAQGVQVESSFSGLRQGIAAVLKPTSDAASFAEELGIQFDAAALRTKGLSGILAELNARGLDTPEILTRLFGSVEAVAAIAPSAGEGFKTLQQNIDASAQSAGESDEAFEKVATSIDGLVKSLQTQFGETLRQIGIAFGPVLQGGLQLLVDILAEAGEQSDGLDAIADAGERLKQAIEGNPELVQRLGEALATVADAAISFAASGIDAITNFVSSADAVDGAGDAIETFADALKATETILRAFASVVQFASENSEVLGVAIQLLAARFALLKLQAAVTGLQGLAGAAGTAAAATGKLAISAAALAPALIAIGAAIAAIKWNQFVQGVEEANDQVESFIAQSDVLNKKTFQTAKAIDELADAYEASNRLSAEEKELLEEKVGLAEKQKALLEDLKADAEAGIEVSGFDITDENREQVIANIQKDIDLISNQIDRGNEVLGSFGQGIDTEQVEQATETLAENASSGLQKVGDEYAELSAQLEAETANQKAALLEQGASQEEVAEVERKALEQRLNQARQKLSELQAINTESLSPEDAQQVQQQILQADQEVAAARIQLAEEAKQAEIDALNETLSRAQEVADIRTTLLDQQSSAIANEQALLNQQQGLSEAVLDLEREKLETRLAQAEAAGDEAEAAQLQQQINQANRDAIQQEFEFKRQNLELTSRQAILDAERQKITAEIALTEAEIAIQKAQAEGASQEEITNLQKVADLRRQALNAASQEITTVGEINALKARELDIREDISEEEQKQSELSQNTQDDENEAVKVLDARLARERELNSLIAGNAQLQAQALSRQRSLLSEQQSLASSELDLEREKLETRLAQAEAAGDEAEAERFRQQITQLNKKAAEEELEFKRQQLELSAKQAEIELRRKEIAAQIALTEAQINLQKAIAEGASGEELANLQALVGLRKDELDAVDDARKANEELNKLKEEQLDVEEKITRENQRQSSIRGNTTSPVSLRKGGPVEAGGLYQVHQDEFFVPTQNGTILNQRDSRAIVRETLSARETAALMGVPAITAGISPNQVQGASMRGVEQRLDQLIEMVASDRQLQVGGNSYTLINESNPYGAIAELQASQLKALIRRRGL